ncbi:MAG TPA: hypothetical protein VM144_07145 [Aestuariivirga sp.]|nr:hypothetical protein [Aestuariivirga sp.]
MKLGSSTLVDSEPAPKNFSLRHLYEYYLRGEIRYRAPLFVAILSVAFQHQTYWGTSENIDTLFRGYSLVLFGLVALSGILSLFALTSRFGIMLFIAIVAIDFIPRWTSLANHTYLALWTIPFAVFFKEWWKSELYSLYLRVTLGIVMFAAFSQKLLAGTYIDGSYLYYLSYHGALTERMFSFACDGTSGVPCVYIKIVSNFILLWQLAVGILLLWGIRSILFLAIEIGFLLGAGLYADEMNFQVLNIALLCLVFRVGMPVWLIVTCVTLLFIDTYTISYLLNLMVLHVT